MMRNLFVLIFSLCLVGLTSAQEQGVFSGNLEVNGNFFIEDESIGATGPPQYDRQQFGSEIWLNLAYSISGFDVGMRFDMFNNSNLLNPQGSYNGQGIGRWYVKKKVDKLGISVGYLYDQIGSGVIFRAFEERPLLIDNALLGARLTYDIAEDWKIKAFAGKQKNLFDLHSSVVRGGSVEGYVRIDSNGTSIAPGAGIVGRTYDDVTMGRLVSAIQNYHVDSLKGINYRVPAKFNTFAASVYNTLNLGKFVWYAEAAYKTSETINDPLYEWTNQNGQETVGKYIYGDGTLFYSTLGFSTKGFGITIEGKRTENFGFQVDPAETQVRAGLNFLPPMSRINTFRLNARYAPATQVLGEKALSMDVRYAPSKKLSFLVNHSRINNLEDELLYREIFTEVVYKYERKWQIRGGIQWQNYNQNIYEGKPEVDILETLTPYVEYLYKFNRKKSLRLEAQYMLTAPGLSDYTNRDLGDWIYFEAEYAVAPKWIFSASDMYNIDPYSSSGETEAQHYPTFRVAHIRGSNRISLSFIKQVQGIVCAGGICRLEPAFSGVRLGLTSNF